MRHDAVALIFSAAPPVSAAASDFGVFAGVGLAYAIDRGGDGRNALERPAYLQEERVGFQAGIGILAARQADLNEVDLSLDHRNETAHGFGYGIGYTRYIYPDKGWASIGPDCAATDRITLALNCGVCLVEDAGSDYPGYVALAPGFDTTLLGQ